MKIKVDLLLHKLNKQKNQPRVKLIQHKRKEVPKNDIIVF